VDSGQWTVDSGQWTVDSGQWTVDYADSGQSLNLLYVVVAVNVIRLSLPSEEPHVL
jgi:hypothetical protein